MRIRKLIFILAFGLAVASALAQDLVVAAAADLNFVLPEIATRFEHRTGKKVTLTFGSSGNFYQQLRNGAPFDIFFSADEQYPKKLEAEGLAEPGSFYMYAVGKIVLVVPSNSKLDISKGLSALLAPEVKKIAIANPQHAPYGRAAVEALKKEGLYEKVKDKLVLGENISQAAQFVQSGNADIGIIAQSLASAQNMGRSERFTTIPESDFTPIRQAAVILKDSKHKNTARTFLDFVRSGEIRGLLTRHGFSTVASEPN